MDLIYFMYTLFVIRRNLRIYIYIYIYICNKIKSKINKEVEAKE
jgi:hypothetical protein